jgi:hypothetical protein
VAPALIAVLWLAAIANIVFGLAPDLPLGLAQNAGETLLEHLQ